MLIEYDIYYETSHGSVRRNTLYGQERVLCPIKLKYNKTLSELA